MALKKLNTTLPPVSLNSNTWGTTTTGIGILTSGTTTTTSTTPFTLQGSTTHANSITWSDGTFMNSDIIEYIDIFYQFMGIDMDYQRFSEMTKEEKKSFIRDLKLQKIIDEK